MSANVQEKHTGYSSRWWRKEHSTAGFQGPTSKGSNFLERGIALNY